MRCDLRMYSEYDACGNSHASSGGWKAYFLRETVCVESGVCQEVARSGLTLWARLSGGPQPLVCAGVQNIEGRDRPQRAAAAFGARKNEPRRAGESALGMEREPYRRLFV